MRAWPLAVIVGITGMMGGTKAQEPSGDNATTNGKDYKVEFTEPKAVSVGVPIDCVLKITPVAPWAVKAETPFLVLLEASAALDLEKVRLDTKDFLDAKAAAKSVHTGCVAKSRGEHTLSAKLSFFLCSHDVCKRTIEQLTTTIMAN